MAAGAWRVPALHLPPEQVTDLLIGLREAEGLFAVRVDDQGWRPLSRCFLHHRKAHYGFVPELEVAAKAWDGEEDLYKAFGEFARHVAKQRSGKLKLTKMRWIQSGTWRVVAGNEAGAQATRAGLSGECGDANYYIDEISVGAGIIEAEHFDSPLGEQWAVERRNFQIGNGDFNHCPKEIIETCHTSNPRPTSTEGLVPRAATAAEPGAPSAERDASDGSNPPRSEATDASAGCPERPPPRCDVPLWVKLRVIE